MVLDGLEEVTGVDVGELVVPDLDVVLLYRRAVQVPPQSEGRLGVTEHDVEEGDYLMPLSLLLALFAVGLVVGLQDAALHVQPEVVLQAAGRDLCLEDALQPGELDLLVDDSQVADVDTVEVQQLGQLVGGGEVVLLVLQHAHELVDLGLDQAVDLLGFDQLDPVPEDLVLELLGIDELRPQHVVRVGPELLAILKREELSQPLNKVHLIELRAILPSDIGPIITDDLALAFIQQTLSTDPGDLLKLLPVYDIVELLVLVPSALSEVRLRHAHESLVFEHGHEWHLQNALILGGVDEILKVFELLHCASVAMMLVGQVILVEEVHLDEDIIDHVGR